MQNILLKSIAEIRGRTSKVRISLPGSPSLEVDLHRGTEDWTTLAGELIGLFNHTDTRTLIYIDELPIFLYNVLNANTANGVQRVRRFLDWFRNDIRSLPGASRISWLVSGSVGLDTLAQTYGMADTINTFSHRTLDAFEHDEAVAFLKSLVESYSIQLEDADITKIVDLIRWPQPYYLQLYFNNLRAFLGENTTKQPTEFIDGVINSMIEQGSDNDFHHWEKRLSIQLTPIDAGHALSLLNRTAHDSQGVRAEQLLAHFQERVPDYGDEEVRREFIRLRDILIRDAYWQIDNVASVNYYSFRLEPLRRWWHRRNSL